MKILKTVVYILGLTPLAWIIPYYLYAKQVKSILGYVYFYDQPSPKILGENYLEVLSLYQKYIFYIEAGVKVWGISILIWVTSSITLLFFSRSKSILLVVLISFIFHFLSFCYFIDHIID